MYSSLPQKSTNDPRYAMETDVHFVRKAVRAIGKLAIKIEPSAAYCINTLLELVATKVSYIVQEATVVIRNIFRKYPNKYESIISTLCENLDSLDEPEAKAAMIWVIGQYADRIEDSDVLLDDFLFTFADETHEVQLALLTATVKLFIQRPTKGQELVPKVLKWATEDTDNPDLRDRGYMYWRLLSSDPVAAKRIIMSEKPRITAESEKLDPVTLEEMCLNVGTLATVYLKPVQQVFRTARSRKLRESPALQKHTLPTFQAREQSDSQPAMNNISITNNSVNSPTAGVDAAEVYFNSISNTDLSNGGFGGSPVTAMQPTNTFIVNQNQPQTTYAMNGNDGNGDLLLL